MQKRIRQTIRWICFCHATHQAQQTHGEDCFNVIMRRQFTRTRYTDRRV